MIKAMKAKTILAMNPTILKTHKGYKFLEHPHLGELSAILVLTPEGKLVNTQDHDYGDDDEYDDFIYWYEKDPSDYYEYK